MKFNSILKFLLGGWLTFGIVDDEGSGEGGEGGEAVGTQNDARLAMFDSIADSAEESRAEEFEEGGESGESSEHDEPARSSPPANSPAPQYPKMKVNGQEVDLTPEIIERAQKVSAADQYLAEAARLKREAEQNFRQPSEQDAGGHIDEDDVALARALQMGSEEEAAQAIQAIRSKSPSLTKDEVVAAARDALQMDEAVRWFQSEYDFIWKDPMLTKLALQRDQELLRADQSMTYRQRYEKIGKELTEWTGKLPRGGFSKKEQAKEAASENVVSIASARAQPVQQEETEESPSDVIAQMARTRGQA